MDKGNDVAYPFVGLVFKVLADKHGKLAYMRLYNGQLKTGDVVLNAVTEETERISRIYQVHAGTKRSVEVAYAGDIVAI
ncbi:UNVERIFIED_CONTAM: elongation factor G, partial [Salmonella enterica subsp. enterica serovar Weltevreden]